MTSSKGLSFDAVERAFGNDTGMENKGDLSERLRNLETKVAVLCTFQEDVIAGRPVVLDDKSDPPIQTDPAERRIRNSRAHGGNILADVETIRLRQMVLQGPPYGRQPFFTRQHAIPRK